LVERIPTGIGALDRLVEGGIPKAASGIIISDRKSPGGLFGQQILWNNLQQGLKCAYFQTRYSSEKEFVDELSGYGWSVTPYLKSGTFLVSDYLTLAELTPDERRSNAFGRDVREVEGRLISAAKLTRFTSQASYDFAIYDDIDLLLRRLDKQEFVDWAGTVAKFKKDHGGVALALVYRANLPTDVLSLVERLGTDCTIELRTEESPDGLLHHYFRVTKMKATQIARHGWIPYIKEREGITAG